MAIRLTIYRNSKDLPILPGSNIFHSTELFHVLEQTPGYTPHMIVAFKGDRPIGKMLCITRRNFQYLHLFKKTYIYGTGEYFDPDIPSDIIFNEMLTYFTKIFGDKSFMLEFRNLEEPLFGYRYFRQNKYFPIRWLRVRNSIHHDTIDKWMSTSRKRQISRGVKNGAILDTAQTPQEIEEFFTMIRNFYSPKIHRYLPNLKFFNALLTQPCEHEMGKIFTIRYKNKIIGGSVCLFSGNTTYLIFSGGMRKTYSTLYPGVLAVWHAMNYARDNGYRHFEFIDAGLPFKRYSYRDFILRFGGKQLSTRRWFKIRWRWLNRILIHIYV
ncbi:GNAT family N-acetyltransferase [uncultured Bacteroides sp.]|uniref:GNAT family N-acetyltransferase n=1 Tax=uncultured Bacteroides sp. TaxID=162156 RepID=UPI0026357743|nr:GNAT family N-acetyltransferase [uncultured Bacteroides sp.]